MGLFDIFKKKNTDVNVQNESAEKTLDHETELKVAEQAISPLFLRARSVELAMFHMTALSQRTKRAGS